ncbi:unnamed protein product [Closterium sp. NIES-65]|nr:unnamed protein product [Closterium sp. NIES-65]
MEVAEVLELLELRVLKELELEALELELVEVLELLVAEVLILEVLELLELVVLQALELETLGLEALALGVLVLLVLVLEAVCGRDRTSFHSFSRFLRPPPVPGTHHMALRPSSVPLRVPLPSPPASSLADAPDPESDSLHAASPTITRLLATVVTDPSFTSTAASALVAELVDFAARCCLAYAARFFAESESVSPPSVGGECALGTDVP